MAKAKLKPLLPGTLVRRPDGRLAEWVSQSEPGTTFKTEHFRCVDSLGLLLKHGAITPAMHEAGQEFNRAFTLAHLSPAGAPPLDRVRGNRAEDSMTERCAGAHQRVDAALWAVGGIGSPGGSAVWQVAGLGRSVKEWSAIEGWNGRALNPYEAKGILVGALGVLAVHYGYLR
jgi:hypothetical protein